MRVALRDLESGANGSEVEHAGELAKATAVRRPLRV